MWLHFSCRVLRLLFTLAGCWHGPWWSRAKALRNRDDSEDGIRERRARALDGLVELSFVLQLRLGCFATAEEAALCVARSPEGRAAAGRAAAAAESQGTLPAVPSGASLKEEDTVPPMPPGAFVKEEGVVPLMPPDAFVKVEVVVKEEEGSGGQPKRQRTL